MACPGRLSTEANRCPQQAIRCRPGATQAKRCPGVTESSVRRFRLGHACPRARRRCPPARGAGTGHVKLHDCPSHAIGRSLAASATWRPVGLFRQPEPHAATARGTGVRRSRCRLHRRYRTAWTWSPQAPARAGTSSPGPALQPTILAGVRRSRAQPTHAEAFRCNGATARSGCESHGRRGPSGHRRWSGSGTSLGGGPTGHVHRGSTRD